VEDYADWAEVLPDRPRALQAGFVGLSQSTRPTRVTMQEGTLSILKNSSNSPRYNNAGEELLRSDGVGLRPPIPGHR